MNKRIVIGGSEDIRFNVCLEMGAKLNGYAVDDDCYIITHSLIEPVLYVYKNSEDGKWFRDDICDETENTLRLAVDHLYYKLLWNSIDFDDFVSLINDTYILAYRKGTEDNKKQIRELLGL